MSPTTRRGVTPRSGRRGKHELPCSPTPPSLFPIPRPPRRRVDTKPALGTGGRPSPPPFGPQKRSSQLQETESG